MLEQIARIYAYGVNYTLVLPAISLALPGIQEIRQTDSIPFNVSSPFTLTNVWHMDFYGFDQVARTAPFFESRIQPVEIKLDLDSDHGFAAIKLSMASHFGEALHC